MFASIDMETMQFEDPTFANNLVSTPMSLVGTSNPLYTQNYAAGDFIILLPQLSSSVPNNNLVLTQENKYVDEEETIELTLRIYSANDLTFLSQTQKDDYEKKLKFGISGGCTYVSSVVSYSVVPALPLWIS